MLTDGDVLNPKVVIDQARDFNSSIRVFTFGLGHDCDKQMVKDVAAAGRGTSTLVGDNDPNLNGLVIKALSNAMEPSLCDTQYGFNGNISDAKEVFRNTLIMDSRILSQNEFNELKF